MRDHRPNGVVDWTSYLYLSMNVVVMFALWLWMETVVKMSWESLPLVLDLIAI